MTGQAAQARGQVQEKVEDVRLTQKELERIHLAHTRFAKSLGDGVRAYLRGYDLSGLDLSQMSFPKATFIGCNFDGARLHKTNLSLSTLVRASFVGADLSEADLNCSDARGAKFDDATCTRTKMNGMDLRSLANTQNKDKGGVQLSTCTSFVSATFEGATLLRCRAAQTDFEGAHFTNVRFDQADLKDAIFRAATIVRSSFTGTDVGKTDFRAARFSGDEALVAALAQGGAVMKRTRLPSESALIQTLEAHDAWVRSNGSEGMRANLSYMDLSGIDFRCGNLAAATLRGADLTDANLSDTVLIAADLSYTVLVRTRCSNADLRGADLTSAVLTDFMVDGAQTGELPGTKLSTRFSGKIRNTKPAAATTASP